MPCGDRVGLIKPKPVRSVDLNYMSDKILLRIIINGGFLSRPAPFVKAKPISRDLKTQSFGDFLDNTVIV